MVGPPTPKAPAGSAKTRAVPSLYRDNFLAKDWRPCPVLRQATPTNFITEPLALTEVLIHIDSTLNLEFYSLLTDSIVQYNLRVYE